MNRIDRFFEIVGVLALVLVVVYRKEIAWTYRNRAALQQASDVAGLWSDLKGALS